MRFYEVSSGVRMPVNEEEQGLLNRAMEARELRSDDLEERDEEVARQMVTRGLFDRHHDDKGQFYTVNSCADLWRF